MVRTHCTTTCLSFSSSGYISVHVHVLLCSFALLGLLCFLRLLLVLTQRLCEEFLEFLIFKFLLRLYEFGLVPYWWVRDESRACGEEGDCEVEGGDEGVLGSVADNDMVSVDVKQL